MTNQEIGRLAGILLNLEDRGDTSSAKYVATKLEYERIRGLPESWSDVRSSQWTPEQRTLAEAHETAHAALVLSGCQDGRVSGTPIVD